MKFIGFEREEEAELWARNRLELVSPPSFFRAMSAIDAAGNFVCVVILTNFSKRNIDINIVIDAEKLKPKETIVMYNGIFGYLFDVLQVDRLTGLVGAENTKSIKATEHFGFKLEGRMRRAYKDGEDLLIYGMLPEEYHQHNWYRE